MAPFLLVAIILQIGLERALIFTLAREDRPPMLQHLIGEDEDYRRERSKNRRRATILSLVITGMLVPTPFWDYIRLAGQAIGLTAVGIFLFGALYLLYLVLSG